MIFNKDVSKGHLLGSNSPRMSNIYMNEQCSVCEKYLEDGLDILRAMPIEINLVNIVICSECAYAIHSAYEANL